jgi:hypothetical protein
MGAQARSVFHAYMLRQSCTRINETKHYGLEVTDPALYSGGYRFKSWLETGYPY